MGRTNNRVKKARNPEAKRRAAKNGKEAADTPSRQELFCRLVACQFKTPYEAYCKAFEWEGVAAEGMKTAESLMQVPEIAERIEQLQPFQISPPLGEDMLTLGEHLNELYQLEKIAVRLGQIGAAVTAAIHRGKASGLYVERQVVAHVTLEQLIAGSRGNGEIDTRGQIRDQVTGEPVIGLKEYSRKTKQGRQLIGAPDFISEEE